MATKEDATLLVQLMQWGSATGLDEALRRIYRPDFLTSPTTEDELGDPDAGKVLYFGETLGTLVKHGVLDSALALDLFWVEGMWSRVGTYALVIRKANNEPRLYENFEALVNHVQ